MTDITFKGKPIKLSGKLTQLGSKAPPFILVNKELSDLSLDSFKQTKLLNIFPSLDTSVCSRSVHTFNKQCQEIPSLLVLNISMDLPFAAARFCTAENLNNAITLSAFRSSFGDDYGLKIADGPLKGLLARAVILLSENNQIEYIELVPEISQEPNYSEAINHIKQLITAKR